MEIGLNGDLAPADIFGIPYETYIGLYGRLLTYRGRQVMRPAYGSAAYRSVDRRSVEELKLAAVQAIEGLYNARNISLTIDMSTREIVVHIIGVPHEDRAPVRARAFSIGFSEGFA